MIIYVESSAAVKLVVSEPETAALEDFLDGMHEAGNTIVSSTLLETEVRRAAARAEVSQVLATEALDRFDLIDLGRAVYSAAGLLPSSNLRSLDAIHVAAALSVSADLVVSYDARQIEAATATGLRVASPA